MNSPEMSLYDICALCQPGDQTCPLPRRCPPSCQTGTAPKSPGVGEPRKISTADAVVSCPQNTLDPISLRTHLDPQGIGHYAIYNDLSEGVKRLVWPPHELGLQQVPTAPIVLKHACVELHWQVCRQHRQGQLSGLVEVSQSSRSKTKDNIKWIRGSRFKN